jgi:hypothetical protein
MNFYLLRQPRPGSPEDLAGRSDAHTEEDCNLGDAIKCDTCNRFLTSLKWLPPFRVAVECWGKHYGDIAEIGDYLIISRRLKEAFTQAGLKGLNDIEPVTILRLKYHHKKPKEAIPCYYKASVARSTTCIDQEASGYVWETKSKVCPECLYDNLKRHRSLIIKGESWNGDDVFFPRGGNGPIVSERFKSVFVQQGFVGAIFIPVEEYGYDYYPWESTDAGGVMNSGDTVLP